MDQAPGSKDVNLNTFAKEGQVNRKVFCLASAIAALIAVFTSGYSVAQESYYKDKVIRMVVGFAAGGGFDTNARVIARHMGKHISGNPTVVVDNMTGAGSQIAANYVYKAAKP